MTQDTRTVIFWGAGATATLGMRLTAQQGKFLHDLATGEKGSPPLRQRVANAVGDGSEPWVAALVDLLTILGDGNEERHSHITTTKDQMDAMRRNWSVGADDDEIQDRILTLRALYDWPALKDVIKVVSPVEQGTGGAGANFLTDLFNILDIHGQSGHGFRVEENKFLTPQRVTGARNALKLLILAMFYIDWQVLRQDEGKKQALECHYDFAEALGRRMQRQGLERANHPHDSRKFYMGDVSFASLNYDPIALWLQSIANRNLNQSPAVPHVGVPAHRLQIFHDLGHLIPSRRISPRNPETRWHPMNEAVAQRLNDPDHGASDRIRISKFLYPHGCVTWRECPDCGKLSSYLGDQWEKDSSVLILPPPLKSFVPEDVKFPDYTKDERREWDKGAVDARACVNCDTLTYAHHTQIVMQSNFKGAPPPYIEEIQRDLRAVVQGANHIVFMGYSLPPDDVAYRAFFAARRNRGPEQPKCSVVVGKDGERRWLDPSELRDLSVEDIGDGERETLKAAQELFGKEHVRFYGGGIPNVFLAGERVTDSAVDRLLNWNDTG